MSDWTCYVLNIYLRYFNLLNTNQILNQVEKQLEKRIKNTNVVLPTINDVFLVCGDFSGIKYNVNQLLSTNYLDESVRKVIENGAAVVLDEVDSNKQKKNDNETSGSVAKQEDEKVENSAAVDIDLENLGFYSIIDTQESSSPKRSSTLPQQSQLNKHHQTKLISSCNILCRERITVQVSNSTARKVPSFDDFNATNSSGYNKLTGHYGIIRQGLCHMAIPRNWLWGGPVSEHCPIWIEIYRRINRDNLMIIKQSPINKFYSNNNNSSYNVSTDSVFLQSTSGISVGNGGNGLVATGGRSTPTYLHHVKSQSLDK